MRLTLEELCKLRDLWQSAWGTQNKTWEKLNGAVIKREGSKNDQEVNG